MKAMVKGQRGKWEGAFSMTESGVGYVGGRDAMEQQASNTDYIFKHTSADVL